MKDEKQYMVYRLHFDNRNETSVSYTTKTSKEILQLHIDNNNLDPKDISLEIIDLFDNEQDALDLALYLCNRAGDRPTDDLYTYEQFK